MLVLKDVFLIVLFFFWGVGEYFFAFKSYYEFKAWIAECMTLGSDH